MSRMTKRIALACLAVALAVGVRPAYAHGFGERYDLPVPLNMFLIGAAATVTLSFVVIGLFVGRRPGELNYPRLNLLRLPAVGPAISQPVVLALIRAVSVAVFALVILAGLIGTDKPIDNLSPTFVWIIWWVGMGYVSALLGNVWALVNPWKIIYEWVEWLFGSDSNDGEGVLYRYPERWSVWPAMVLFFAFAWTENVYSSASQPSRLALLVLLYSTITWAGMAVFGKHQWLRHGEAFSVLFGFFARFSPTEVRVAGRGLCSTCDLGCIDSASHCVDCYQCFERASPGDRQLNLRPYAVGLALPQRVTTATAAFVVLALATVTFDGFQDTGVWADVQNAALDGLGSAGVDIANTLGLIMIPTLFLLVYLGFSWGIRQMSGVRHTVPDTARAFVFSLVPIALAYNLAHFISLLAIQGQLIIPLASDPFGFDWDIFGSADYQVNLNAINAKFVWFVSVIAIVLGHIISVYIAHLVSLGRMPDTSSALRSQYPMLVLMVLYTATSLWIIAQPIVQG